MRASDLLNRLDPDQAFVTGGAVRDFVLGRAADDVRDIDLIYTGDISKLASDLRNRYVLGETLFGNPRVELGDGITVDIFPPASPSRVALTLPDALKCADMSGNSLALPLNCATVIDPNDGYRDLLRGRTRLLEAGWDAAPEIVAALLRRVVDHSLRIGLTIQDLHIADVSCVTLSRIANGSLSPELRAAVAHYRSWRTGVGPTG
ncbi:hypothetical protein BU204_34645 [Actinophytocola xanthii]|uniref:Poly A polymerase head domain-containing protein n=1 Tax=Actinophytocola xanthii TaxID=1912961 RepID=A0A1Q8C1N2_9PSEU|nr:hypothetical protein BU204_34645 [Actinophytocola xanthii]